MPVLKNPGAMEVRNNDKFHGCFFAFCPCPLLQHQLNSIIRHDHNKGHLHPPSCTGNALSQRLKTRNKTALGRAGFLIQWDHNGTKRHPPYVRCKNKGTCFHLGVRMMTWCPPRHQLEIPPRSWLIGIFCASCISVPAALVIRSESKE